MSYDKANIDDLLFRFLENEVSEHDITMLNQWFLNDPEAARYYCNYARDYAAMRMQVSGEMEAKEATTENTHEFDIKLWKELAEDERTAPTVEIERPHEAESRPFETIQVVRQERHVSRFSIVTLVLSAAAILLIAIFLRLNPPEPAVAFLLDSRNAVWSGGDELLENGAGIKPGPLSLTGGYANVVLTSGVEIVLEGPVTVDIESDNQVFLLRGAIYSKVPTGVDDYLVRTSGATVVDYGTEFAVDVDDRGATAVHVVKGEVELRSGADVVKHGPVARLLAKQAAAVNAEGVIEEVEFAPDRYVTSIPSDYDIAVLKSKPIAYWRFANYGSPVNEIVSKTYSTVVVGAVSATGSSCLHKNLHYQALNLDGQGGHIAIDVNKQPAVSSGWSYALWIRPELQSASQEEPYCYILSGKGQYGYLRISDTGILEHYFVHGDGTVFCGQVSKKPIEFGQWHHIVVTVEYGQQKNLYVDGVKATDASVYDRIRPAGGLFCEKILVGTGTDPSAAVSESENEDAGKSFRGDISQVALYGRPLSEDAVRELFLSIR